MIIKPYLLNGFKAVCLVHLFYKLFLIKNFENINNVIFSKFNCLCAFYVFSKKKKKEKKIMNKACSQRFLYSIYFS